MKEALDEPEKPASVKTYKYTRGGDVPLIGSNITSRDAGR